MTLYLACEDGVKFDSGYNPGPVESESPLRISLDVLVGITELSNEYVQQDHYTSQQKQHHQNGTQSSATFKVYLFRADEFVKIDKFD